MFVDLCYVGNLNFANKNTVTNSLFEAFEGNNAEIFYDAAINVGDNHRRGLRKKEINKIPIENVLKPVHLDMLQIFIKDNNKVLK